MFAAWTDAGVLAKGNATEAFTSEQHAVRARKKGERDMEMAALNIKTEYRKRLVDSKDLLARLQQQLALVANELVLCEAARAEGLKALQEFQRPISLTLQWMVQRKTRPPSPSQDDVERALAQSQHELKQGIGQLAGELADLDAALSHLRDTKRRFEDEIKDKASAIVLDKVCMMETLAVPDVPADVITPTVVATARIPAPPDATPGRGTLSGRQARKGAAHMQSIGMHTDSEWRNTTMVSISRGTAVVEVASRARKVLLLTTQALNNSGKLRKPAVVVDALVASIKTGTQHCTALKYNAKMVVGEMQQLVKQQQALQQTIEKVQSQLRDNTRRLELQLVRPTSESTRTEVEQTLELEVIKLKGVESNLKLQAADLESKKRRLHALQDKIGKEIDYRMDGLSMNHQCQTMELPSLPDIADRFKQPQVASAAASSPKAHAQAR